MSMNLYCNAATLWQTPTWITRIALYNRNGKIRKPEETLYIYTEWVKQSLNGVWEKDELELQRQVVSEHLRNLEATKIASFWEM